MSQPQSPFASTTPEALRAAIAEAVQVDAQQLHAAVGSIQVATSEQLQVTDSEIKSLYDADSRTLTLLADRIPAGQEKSTFAAALVLHVGLSAATDLVGNAADAHELVVDGLDDQFNFAGDGQRAPFVVFSVERQENIAGPFPTRDLAEQQRSRILQGATPHIDTDALIQAMEAAEDAKALKRPSMAVAKPQPAPSNHRVKSYRVKFTGHDGKAHNRLEPFTQDHANSVFTTLETDGIPLWAARKLVAGWAHQSKLQGVKREYSIPFVRTKMLEDSHAHANSAQALPPALPDGWQAKEWLQHALPPGMTSQWSVYDAAGEEKGRGASRDAAVASALATPQLTNAAINSILTQALPEASGYEKGYRDALESISLALAQKVADATLRDAINTALDAYANNADHEETLTQQYRVLGAHTNGNFFDIPVEANDSLRAFGQAALKLQEAGEDHDAQFFAAIPAGTAYEFPGDGVVVLGTVLDPEQANVFGVAPGTAYEVSIDDVVNVLNSNKLSAGAPSGQSHEDLAEDLFHDLDFAKIEEAALAGDDLDEQTDYANDEITRQLREMGILEPSHEDSPSPGM